MNQNTSVESSTQSLPNQSINPALQAALGSLDVQLEEELARYRRQQAGRPVMRPSGLGRYQTRKPLELIPVDKAGGQTQPLVAGKTTAAPMMSFPLALVNKTPERNSPKETQSGLMTQTGQLDAPEAPADAPVFPSLTNATPDSSATEESLTEQLTPPEKPADVGGNLMPLAADQAQPEDYLESSEKLLRSLAQEQAGIRSEKRFTARLLTPLGIGSILLLLLSSATLAYIFTNPSTLSDLGLNRFFGSKTPTTAKSPTETTVARGEAAKNSSMNGPNLAVGEFTEVNLDTLSQLEASSTPTPTPYPPLPDLHNSGATSTSPPVVPNSALPGRSSDLSSALLQPSLQPGAVPSTAVPPLAPVPAPGTSAAQVNTPSGSPAKSNQSPAPAIPATTNKAEVASSAAPVRDNFYYVVLNSTGESALEEARKIVPEAYVENFPIGPRISMGAFMLESEAKTLVDQLKQQGISATIYSN